MVILTVTGGWSKDPEDEEEEVEEESKDVKSEVSLNIIAPENLLNLN